MARETYEAYALRRLPKWLRGTWADKTWSVLFGAFDLTWAAILEAVKSGLIMHSPDDAVDAHARGRLLERATGESTAALRERARDAWTFWSELAPTNKLVEAINFYTGLSPATLWGFTNSGAWHLGYTGADSEDDNTDNWSRHFMVVAKGSHPWLRPTVGSGLTVGPGLLVGITMTSSELSLLRRAYRDHRPGHMVGGSAYILFDATPAADVAVVDHQASGDYAVIPLQVQMVGYEPHGMIVGDHMPVGHTFT